MTDPRNIAHDKKVQQEKKHHHEAPLAGTTHAVQPGRKPHMSAPVLAPDPDAEAASPADSGPAQP
jgi:hypothetical protein